MSSISARSDTTSIVSNSSRFSNRGFRQLGASFMLSAVAKADSKGRPPSVSLASERADPLPNQMFSGSLDASQMDTDGGSDRKGGVEDLDEFDHDGFLKLTNIQNVDSRFHPVQWKPIENTPSLDQSLPESVKPLEFDQDRGAGAAQFHNEDRSFEHEALGNKMMDGGLGSSKLSLPRASNTQSYVPSADDVEMTASDSRVGRTPVAPSSVTVGDVLLPVRDAIELLQSG
ncbi:hypothetical protein BT69DRAFT_29267 [Atractiella rhizophila]|nr:hypothetical protein BT69DRAFT_29267 [Atractiella rhizophila]